MLPRWQHIDLSPICHPRGDKRVKSREAESNRMKLYNIVFIDIDGAAYPNRTDDLPLTRRLLYQLS